MKLTGGYVIAIIVALCLIGYTFYPIATLWVAVCMLSLVIWDLVVVPYSNVLGAKWSKKPEKK